MKDLPADRKQKAILQSAWKAFSAYGFRKTSMDDIARGAGMSRPALYLHYRSKEDIFRSLAQSFYDDAVRAVEAALAGTGPVADLLADAFAAQGGDAIGAILGSPHGMELLDTGTATAADIAEAGEARLRAVYSAWLKKERREGRIRLPESPELVAATITAALKGIKAAGPDYATYAARVANLAALIGAGLAVGR